MTQTLTSHTLTHEDVLAMYNTADSNTILVNVLPPEYHNMAHIPHSLNIPIDLEDFVDVVKSQTADFDNVVLYCANEACTASSNALAVLQDAGLDNVYDFEGGMQEWLEAGGPLNTQMDGGGCCGGGCDSEGTSDKQKSGGCDSGTSSEDSGTGCCG